MEWNKEDLEKIRKRDSDIFEKIYKEYKIKIYNYLLIKTNGDIDVSNEILCETFHSALESAPKLKNTKNLQGWLILIANRRLNDYLRKKYRNENFKNSINTINDESKEIIEDIHTTEQLLHVNLALEKLKPAYKEVLKLKYIEEKSQKEISEIMKKTVSSIESLLVRAKKSLKRELNNTKGFLYE